MDSSEWLTLLIAEVIILVLSLLHLDSRSIVTRRLAAIMVAVFVVLSTATVYRFLEAAR